MLVKLQLFCEQSGFTDKAIRRKIEDGRWLEHHEYVRAPDGSILIDQEGYELWARHSRKPSASSQRAPA